MNTKAFIPEAESIVKKALDGIVESGFVPGCAVAIGKGGEKAFEVYSGIADKETGRPVQADTCYRMYSMTKILTVAAIMQLWDRGQIRLNDRLSKFIPEYKNQMVAERQLSGAYEMSAAKREIMIFDLLTMTSGIPYDAEGPTGQAVSDIARRAREARENGNEWDTLRLAKEFAGIPLLFHPGTYFQYGLSHDILGAVVEVITGENLYEYLKNNFFEPLGMKDACFEINDNNKNRMAGQYNAAGRACGGISSNIIDSTLNYDNPKFFSGGAGLICTMDDYFKFARMLAKNGTVDGKRYLSRKAVELLRSPKLNERQLLTYNSASENPDNIYRGYNYGFGVRVCEKENLSANANSKGEYGWAGALGTWMLIDPKEDIFLVYVHQRTPVEHEAYVPQLTCAVYSSLE